MSPKTFIRRRALIVASGRSSSWKKKAMSALLRESKAETIFVKKQHKISRFLLPSGEYVCAKRRYVNLPEAESAIGEICSMVGISKRPSRAYFCGWCRGYHATSMSF